jgi:quercetin dioxygenase-like cupin family protein
MTNRIALLVFVTFLAATTLSAQHMKVASGASRATTRGDAKFFTGQVFVQPLFDSTAATRANGGQVTFTPGSRSAWHTHPAGQALIVTAGSGWVQEWNGTKREITAGDVVWTPPGVKHWHGAKADTTMTHIAIQEHVDGKNVDWLEHVSDDQYDR